MDPWRTYPLQNHNPSGSPRVPGRVSTNQDIRQRENDGRPRQPLPPPVVGNPRNPGYDVPRNSPQQVRSPVESRRVQTTLPSNPEAGREDEPPTPRREGALDAQGLDNWHYDTLRSLPPVTQPRNVHMSASGGNSSHGMSINVPFSRRPPDLTGSVERIDQFPDKYGGYADVWKCKYYKGSNREGKEMVAVKCIRLLSELTQEEKERAIKQLRGEVHIWVRLPLHSHVLPLYGTVDGFAPIPALVSPWAENGTLTTYLGSKRQLPYSRRLEIILQVTSGLGHLHSSNICHGDLTGSNILIDRNEDMLISDFGLSSIIAKFNHTSYFKSCRPGAIRWADPQLFTDSTDANDSSLPRADMKNDIYSMGCIILQVVTGSVPYHGKSDWAVQLAKYNKQNPVIPPTVSQYLADLMGICWSNDQSQRPTLEGIRRTIQWELNSQM